MSQWLDRIKYGNGHDGSPAVTGTINTYAACTGTATETSLTTALAANAGDVILIHQSQGTGAGQWELNYVLADAGTTLTLAYPLAYTYGTGAQAVLVPQYTGGTLSGAVTGQAWNGSTGGIISLICNANLVITGSLNIAGGNGQAGGSNIDAIAAGGFRAGQGMRSNQQAYSGEGYTGYGSQTRSANTIGGGGGNANGDISGGGGGGYGTGGSGGGDADGGIGGGTVGGVALTSLYFGGGGGGGGEYESSTQNCGSGGRGGGIILIIAKSIDTSSASGLFANGGNGGNAHSAGGGGAGGSILIKCQKAILGTNKINANNGSGGSGNGGAGGVGRIHIDYADSISGTTTPTLDSTQVTTLKSQVYGGMI